MNREKPIGVFDSGIGGLSVLKQFVRFLPNEKYVYLGDTARVPYGNKSPDTVIRYSLECTKFLLKQEVKMIVVACNSASSNALNEIKRISPVPVIGMIQPAASAALRASISKKIGIIGTRATVNSKAYYKAINSLTDNEIELFDSACPMFVPLVEEGWEMHQAAKLIVEEYLTELKSEKIDTLVLGCTHYPLLNSLISDFLPGVILIDSGEHAAVHAVRILAEDSKLVEEKNDFITKPDINFFVTDLPSNFEELAKRFLGFEIESPVKLNANWTY